jgi:predicted HD phosphohydrolase
MNSAEVAAFKSSPYYADAVTLRRWDDQAKDPTLQTPSIEHFARYIDQAVLAPATA